MTDKGGDSACIVYLSNVLSFYVVLVVVVLCFKHVYTCILFTEIIC